MKISQYTHWTVSISFDCCWRSGRIFQEILSLTWGWPKVLSIGIQIRYWTGRSDLNFSLCVYYVHLSTRESLWSLVITNAWEEAFFGAIAGIDRCCYVRNETEYQGVTRGQGWGQRTQGKYINTEGLKIHSQVNKEKNIYWRKWRKWRSSLLLFFCVSWGI